MYGEKLKNIRKSLSYTQEKMSEVLNISNRTYAAYERNENNPPYSMLVNLCQNHNINLNWFIADKGEMFLKQPVRYEQVEAEFTAKVEKILKEKGLI